MKIKFLGAGSAFNKIDGQSNALVTSDSGKNLLIDCGSYLWTLSDLNPFDVDAVYISHLHADHIGGLEELAFITYFCKKPRPKLYCNVNVMRELWEHCLQGGLASIQGKVVTLTEYFECIPVENNDDFEWEGSNFTPVQTVHVMAGYTIKYSYGLLIDDYCERKAFFTTDVQFCPHQILDFYNMSYTIFQDCETAPYKSGVHASYDDLKTLHPDTKAKMWLYHYQPNPTQNPVEDGFKGFVKKGQEFIL